jgi:hypothetical protein
MKHTTMKHPMIAGLAVLVTSLTVQGAEPKTGPDTPAADDVSKRLPDIPTCASPYSDYAPYLCYPGSDKYYSFPGIRDPWVFNRAMVWLEQKDGVDGPPICYSGGDSLWLSGKQQASCWRGGTITQNADNSTTFAAAPADEGAKLPFFTGAVDPEIMKLSIGHACTSPFQFNLEQHPKAILEVTDATAPWRFMVVLKGREGKPAYICDWKTGAGNLEVDLRHIYRTLGYQGNFAHVYFLFSIAGPQDKPKSATFRLHMAGEGAVISSLPVIRTDQRQRQEGVPLACIVVDEQARKLGVGTVAVMARVNGKTYAMKETGGIWRTSVHDLPLGDHRVALEAEWLGSEKKRVAMLDVSVTDGKFIGFDSARSLLTYDGKPMPPMAGSETGKLIYQKPDTPNESLVCDEKEWSEVVAAAKGGKLDIADRWWEGLTEKDQEKQAKYLASCGFDLMHLSSWWHHWERTEYLDHVAPYGAERLAGTLRANRKHGVFLYFNLANHHPSEEGCVPYQQQVDAGIQKWSYALDSGWVKTYLGYAAAFARLFSDETSLLAVSANGERDRNSWEGSRDFVNHTYDIYRAADPNHLVITEFDTFDDPMAVTAFKPKPAGFRTYTCHDRDKPYGAVNIRLLAGKYKVELMRPHPYQAEGAFWGQMPVELHGYEGDSPTPNRDQGKILQSPKAMSYYRRMTREETYLALVYRMPMCMTWGECIIADERKVHQDVRQRVNWTQEWKPAPLAIRVKADRDKSLEPDLYGCARLIDEPYKYEERMNALSLETSYLWKNAPVPDGVAHVIDLNKQSGLNPAFASDGGDLPDLLKDLRPIVVPGGQTHYAWSRDGRTLLAYLPNQIPGSTLKLQGFPDESLQYRLYDLDKKETVATGGFQKRSALKLPENGDSFFLLVTP